MTGEAVRPRSFDEAALAYVDPLYGMALRLTRDTARAEDLVQDTYVKAFRHWRLFQEGTNLKAWLFKILTNTFLNEAKRWSRRGVAVDFDAVEDFHPGLATSNGEVLTRDGRPIDDFLHEVLDEQVKTAVDELREPFRTVFLLVDLEEFSYQEAADILGVAIGTVRSRLFRARAFLAERLADYAAAIGIVSRPASPCGSTS